MWRVNAATLIWYLTIDMQTTTIETEIFGTPIGNIELKASAKGLISLAFLKSEPAASISQKRIKPALPVLREAIAGLEVYFEKACDFPEIELDLTGISDFQKKVLAATCTLKLGQLATYAQIAKAIGMPGASRAVGTALAKNPVLLYIPCHRVIGSDAYLHGFAAPQGTAAKAWLLRHEGHEIIQDRVIKPRERSSL